MQHGVNGFLVGPAPEAFAKFMDTLVENDALRTSMSEAARETSRVYRWDLTVRRYASLYGQLIRSHAQEPRFA